MYLLLNASCTTGLLSIPSPGTDYLYRSLPTAFSLSVSLFRVALVFEDASQEMSSGGLSVGPSLATEIEMLVAPDQDMMPAGCYLVNWTC